MMKRKLLITVLILITAASLGAAVFFYNQAKHQQQSPPGTQTSAPGGSETSDGGDPASSTGKASGGSDDRGPTSSTGGASSDSDGGETSGPQTSPAQNPLQAQIEQKYTARLQSTGSSYEGRLNSLLASAVADYQAAKKADPNADITPLTNKYYAAGQALEAECDAKMYAILDAFENELRANSLPVDAAVRARAAYDAAKSDRAGQILSAKP
ncbi:hypothetical protein Psfp_02414 [Pelotomaculum sp. FP]|nr:hypothetical protein Psfp_02414 [Pelotomaculum sp. FP]